MPPCERACRLSATSKLWACTSWEVRGRKLGELPGHPGPDGVARRKKKHLGHLEGRGKPTRGPTNGELDDCAHRGGVGVEGRQFEKYLYNTEQTF